MRRVILSLMLGLLAGVAAAQPSRITGRDRSKDLEDVGITAALGQRLPLSLAFTDADGKTVRLAELFGGSRPVLLTFNYFRCPSLCSRQLNALLDALRGIDLQLGRDFQIVTASFDSRDTAAWARMKQASYLKALGRPDAVAHWRFLTGDSESITRLSRTVGFRYRWIAARQAYAHPAFLAVCTPDGTPARYLAGVAPSVSEIRYPARSVKLALVEASEGRISSPVDQALLFCLLRYDRGTGKYSLAVFRLLQLSGLFTVVVLGTALLLMRRRSRASQPSRSATR